MKHIVRFPAILILILGIFSCSGDSYSDNSNPHPAPAPITTTFKAALNGLSEVPSNNSAATGTAVLRFNETTKIFSLTVTYSGLTPTEGHIHVGAIGVAGVIVFPLSGLTSPITYTSPVLTATQEANLKEGRYYINLHSTAFPNGEIRGQFKTDPGPGILILTASLNSANETPSNTSTATGSAVLAFDTSTKIFSLTVTYNGLAPTEGHIHTGSIGVSGPIVFSLTGLASPITYTSPALTAAQETDLKEGRYYINLHTTAFPGGEIRGQLSTDPAPGILILNAILNGANEVPSNASTASGRAALVFNTNTKIFSLAVTYSGLTPTEGHIHIGAVGIAGPIVFPLTSVISPITYISPALTTAQEADLKEGRYYVNLHTTGFPGGEIRGQFDNPTCAGCWDY